MKKVVKISVAAVVLAIVAVAAFVVIREKSMPIKEEKVIANLEWGMTSQEAKLAMARKKYTEFEYYELGQISVLLYQIRDYQEVEGANCEVMLLFDEDKLNSGTYSFRMESDYFEAEPGKYYSSKEMLDKLQVMFAKRYESSCIESISEEHHEERLPTDPDYARYFVGEASLVFVSRSPERLDVRFEDSSSQEMKALIGALKLLDATDAPSPSGYFSKRGE